MNWDDYRYIRELARTGSVRGAAEAMGVNASTVTRRLEGVEAELGLTLFVRQARGLEANEAMLDVVADLNQVAHTLEELGSRLKSFNESLAGSIKLALPDALATDFLLRSLGVFRSHYPQIELEVMPSYQNLNIGVLGVDVAIWATRSPPEDLIGRPLSRFGLAAYAHADLVDEPAEVLPWVEWAGSGEIMNTYRALRERYFPGATVQLRCDHVPMQFAALCNGLGAGILPCFLGEERDELRRLDDMPVQTGPTLWLLSRPDQRGLRRVHVLLEFLTQVFEERRDWLEVLLPSATQP